MGYEDDKHPRDEHGRFTSGGLPTWTNAKLGIKSARDRFNELPQAKDEDAPDGLMGEKSKIDLDIKARERTKDTTPAQARAIGLFTNSSDAYQDIRAAEKGVPASQWAQLNRRQAQEAADDLASFFKTAKPTPGMVYRGMAANDEKLKALLDNDTITMAATSSTSRDIAIARDFSDRHVRNDERDTSVWAGGADKVTSKEPPIPVVLRLKEKSGVMIHHMAATGEGEAEVLMPKGATFHITKRTQASARSVGGKYLVIDAEEK